MIYYPAAIFQDAPDARYGVIIPDLPGCYPLGDTLEEAIADAKAAAAFHIEGMMEEGLPFATAPRPIAEHRANPDYRDAVAWVVIEVDEGAFSRPVRFNVSWSEYLLAQVDEFAAARHDTRSGFLAKAARAAMTENA